MVALPLGIIHTRHILKEVSMMFTHRVYDIGLGVVDISTPCAAVCESILLPMLMARNLGLLMTLPYPVQGMYTVHAVMYSKMVALPLGISHPRNR